VEQNPDDTLDPAALSCRTTTDGWNFGQQRTNSDIILNLENPIRLSGIAFTNLNLRDGGSLTFR
jgi:hypothetical protein